MKKLLLIPLICVMFGCTATKPTTTAPVINQTITVNQTTITGDSNKIDTETVAKNDQASEPTVKTEQTTKNGLWIYLLIITVALGVGGYIVWRKYRGKI